MHASMRAANVFQGASQGIKTMDGHPKNIVCPTPPAGRLRGGGGENINHAGVVSPLWEYASCVGDCQCRWQWRIWLHQ